MPFSFIPTSGSTAAPAPGALPTRVRALEDRIACEITFPRLVGYRYEVPAERLHATFSAESKLALSTADIPTKTENRPIGGEASTARTLWVPAVNNHRGFGRWAFVEVADPWDAQRTIRAVLASTGVAMQG